MFRLYTIFRKKSLKYKLLFIVLFNVAIISTFSFLGYYLAALAYNNMLFNAIAGNLSFASYTISDKLKRIESMSSMVISSPTIQNELSVVKNSSDASELANANRTFNASLLNYYSTYKTDGIAYMTLYNDKFYNCTNWALLNKTDPDLIARAKENAIEADGAITWNTGKRSDYLILSRHIRKVHNLSLAPLGDIIICVDLNNIVSTSNQAVTQYDDANYILTDKENQIIYASESLSDEDASYFLKNSRKPYQIITLNKKPYFSIMADLPGYDYKYINLISFASISKKLKLILLIISLALLCGIPIVVFLSNYIINNMIRQFDVLIQKMHTFSKNEFMIANHPGTSYSDDEIGQLHQQFDLMADNIQHLIQVNYINELLKKDAKLKALEAQINPHFLYNTLESINWHAKASGDTQISLLVESLGSLLRATLSNKNSLVSLEYELSLADSYLTIQKIRYEDRLIYDIKTDHDLKNAVMPPLIIQPLLENAIRYGVEEMLDHCHIYVKIEKIGANLSISVKNEGSQFEPDILEKLKNEQGKTHGFGIGLMNIDQRIKLLFGEEYGLSLSNENDYAVATLIFPFKSEVS